MTAEITSTNMIQPPPCGHMNGTHPHDCWWPITLEASEHLMDALATAKEIL